MKIGEVDSMSLPWPFQDVTVADKTGETQIRLWRSRVNTLTLDTTYDFKKMVVKAGEPKTVRFSFDSSVQEAKDKIEKPKASPAPVITQTVIVTNAEVATKKYCSNCNHDIEVSGKSQIYKCHHCKMGTHVNRLVSRTTIAIVAYKSGNDPKKYFVRINAIPPDVMKKSPEEIEEYLLIYPSYDIVLENDSIIINIIPTPNTKDTTPKPDDPTVLAPNETGSDSNNSAEHFVLKFD